MIVAVFAVVLIVLPFGLTGIRSLGDMVLFKRAQQHLSDVLPAAWLGLNHDALSCGQPVLDEQTAIRLVSARFHDQLPAMLTDRLKLESVSVFLQVVPRDPDHWMGDDQPRRLPVVMIRAVLMDHGGRSIQMGDRIQWLMD